MGFFFFYYNIQLKNMRCKTSLFVISMLFAK